MGAPLLGRHLAELQSAPTPVVVIAALGSFAGQLAAVLAAMPLWVYLLAAFAPWLPIVVLELVWTYRHYRWLAVFCVLLITQTAYVFEQLARVIQVYLQGTDSMATSGIVGAIDPPRVQVMWTTWAFFGVLLLVNRFPLNRWLWPTLAVVALDAVLPHTPVVVPIELEFGLGIAAVVSLELAFAQQLRHTYDAWLARAFPQLPETLLIEASSKLQELRLRPGERVHQLADRTCIVTRGKGQLLREGPGGHEILLSTLTPGQVVSDGGTLVAETTLELLVVPAGAIT